MKIIIFIILAACCSGVMDTIKHHWYRSKFNFNRRGTRFRQWLWKWLHQNSWELAYEWVYRSNGFPAPENLFPYSLNGNKYKILKQKVWFTIFGIQVKKLPQLIDGWHFFKSLMIMLILLPYALWGQVVVIHGWNHWLLDWFVLGLAWNIPFNIMYNKILIKKSYR